MERTLMEEVGMVTAIWCNQCPAVFIGKRFGYPSETVANAEAAGWRMDNPFGAVCPECKPYTDEELDIDSP